MAERSSIDTDNTYAELQRRALASFETALALRAANLTLRTMTYVDAAVAPLRKTGQIKIHGPAAFEAMRKAGQLVARCLDMLTEHVGPGVPTEKIDNLVFDFAMDHGALPATLMYRGYQNLHVLLLIMWFATVFLATNL